MNGYVICFLLFLNIFPLEAVISKLDEVQRGYFKARDNNKDNSLSVADLQSYHEGDDADWGMTDGPEEEYEVTNRGLFKNKKFFDSINDVITGAIQDIDKKIGDFQNDEVHAAAAAQLLGDNESIAKLQNFEVIYEKKMASTKRRNKLAFQTVMLTAMNQILYERQAYLEILGKVKASFKLCSTDSSVQEMVTALFAATIYHKSGGKRNQLTLDEFVSFLSDVPASKECFVGLIQNAFKEYMLGLLKGGSTGVITQSAHENFLRTHCLMKDVSGSFEYFSNEISVAYEAILIAEKEAKAKNITGKNSEGETETKAELDDGIEPGAQVEKVRKVWAKMSLKSAFNTLVKT